MRSRRGSRGHELVVGHDGRHFDEPSRGLLDLGAKGTIRNKEVFNRTHYERLADVDITSFVGMIDQWVLEYAELYAAKS